MPTWTTTFLSRIAPMFKQSFRRRMADSARLRAKYRRSAEYRLYKANAYRARVGKPLIKSADEIQSRND
jgi:hypothetical protein